MAFWDQWIGILKNPEAEFGKAIYDASFASALLQMTLASVIVGLISAMTTYFSVPQELAASLPLFLAASMAMSGLSIFFGWLLLSFIVLALSRITEGKGSFALQSYLIALFLAPLSVVSVLLSFIPFGVFLVFLLFFYDLYLLFLSIKVAHGFDVKKAAVVVLLSLLLIVVLAGVINAIFSLFAAQPEAVTGI
jgi:hypothetical protein